MRRLLTDRFIAHVTVFTLARINGIGQPAKRYYGSEIKRVESTIWFNCFRDFRSPPEPKEFNLHAVLPDDSPQSKIAQRFAPELSDGSKVADWELYISNLIDAILHAPAIDPILQVNMLLVVLEAGGEGSEPVREVCEAAKANLRGSPKASTTFPG